MANQCTALRKDRTRCRGTALPGTSTCFAHAPDLQARRIEGSRRGGHGKSNKVRAKKALTDAALTPQEIAGLLSKGMRDVAADRMEPGRLTAIAAAARTLMGILAADDLELRIQELEGKIPPGSAERERERRGVA